VEPSTSSSTHRKWDAITRRNFDAAHPAGLVERGNHTIQGIVLTEVQNLVLPREVVVEICRRKGGRGCDVAHTGLREPTDAKLFSRGAQDLQAPRKIAPPQMAIALALGLAV
jgi:hypothetical protein